jgi:glutamate/tyrosine decarboxylase-like PLP-dependent enzyme
MASFVTKWMEPEASTLMQDCMDVNIVDMDEYPSTTDIHNRWVGPGWQCSMLVCCCCCCVQCIVGAVIACVF